MLQLFFKYSALITLYFTVSTQTELNEAVNPFEKLHRVKRNQVYVWELQYWPEGYRGGIGPPIEQQNVYNQNNHHFNTHFAAAASLSNERYNPINYDQAQSKRHLEIKREPQLPFVPDYVTPVQNILKNIPYSWVPSNNPGQIYTHVFEGDQNPLKNIFNAVFGPENTDRILQTGQPTSFQNQGQYQNNNNYNNYEYSNRDYENNINRQQTNDVNIQPSVTEAIGEHSGNVYNTQYNTPYNNNHYPTSGGQYNSNQQTTFNDQNQPVSSQAGYAHSSVFSSGTSSSSQASNYNTPNQVNHRPQSPTPVPFQNTYSASAQSQSNSIAQSSKRPSSTNNIQANSQFQFSQPAQTQNVQAQQTSGWRDRQSQNNQQEVQYKTQYQTTTTSKTALTRPSPIPDISPQQSTGRTEATNTIRQQSPQILKSTPYPTTKLVINSRTPPYTNEKINPTTKRVLSSQTTQKFFTESPKLTEQNQVTENSITAQKPAPNNNKSQEIAFRGDALEFYGTVLQNVSYAALPNKTNPVSSGENRKKIKPTTTVPTPVKTENRFGFDSESSNQISTTKKPVKKCDNPTSRPVPSFAKPGRRISQTKCYEYIWQQQERVAKWDTKKECHRAQNEMIYIAGREGMPALYPHMTTLGWSGINGGWIFKCAGALISPKFVLTAAHCSKTPPRDNSVLHSIPQIVRLGDRDVAEPIRGGTISVDVGIKSIIVHPEYLPPKPYNDIALIELQKPITFTRHVQPACLWSNPDTNKLGNQFIATGWGVVDTAYQTNPPPMLQKVAVRAIDSDTCYMFIQPYCNMNSCQIADQQICGTGQNGSLNSCLGDSGAPLQAKIPLSSDSEGSMHYIIGVMSFRIGCENSELPAIYTRVSSYISWIESVVWK